MAVTASKLLQNPEANLPSMRSLLTLATDQDSQASLPILKTDSISSILTLGADIDTQA